MTFIRSLVFISIFICVVMFCINNREHVVIDFFPLAVEISVPLFWVILAALLVGGFVFVLLNLSGACKNILSSRSKDKEIKLLRRRLSDAQMLLPGDKTHLAKE